MDPRQNLCPHPTSDSRHAGRVIWLIVSCSAIHCKEPTQITLDLRTDIPWEPGRHVAISAATYREPSKPLAVTQSDWQTDGRVGTFVITPQNDKNGRVWIRAVAGLDRDPSLCNMNAPNGCVFARRNLSFMEHTPLLIEMSLHRSCAGKACDETRTCNAIGDCVSAEVDPRTCARPAGCSLPDDDLVADAYDDGGNSGGDVETDGGRRVEDAMLHDGQPVEDAVLRDSRADSQEASPSPQCPNMGRGPNMKMLPSGVCVDVTEVTVAQYGRWLATNPTAISTPECAWKTQVRLPGNWPTQQKDKDHPVVLVDWCEASAFCQWAGKRLCASMQGEIASPDAADATEWTSTCTCGGAHTYPWGESEPNKNQCNIFQGPSATVANVQAKNTCQCSEPNYAGVFDLIGNVEEWVDECSGAGAAQDPCAARGGSFSWPAKLPWTCVMRAAHPREERSDDLGFRCCGRPI